MSDFFKLLIFCSWILVISLINGIQYFFLKRKLKLIYEEHKEEIYKAIRCNNITFLTFYKKEPLETGNDMLDLLLFKIHRSAMWFILSLFFYITSIVFVVLAIAIIRRISMIG